MCCAIPRSGLYCFSSALSWTRFGKIRWSCRLMSNVTDSEQICVSASEQLLKLCHVHSIIVFTCYSFTDHCQIHRLQLSVRQRRRTVLQLLCVTAVKLHGYLLQLWVQCSTYYRLQILHCIVQTAADLVHCSLCLLIHFHITLSPLAVHPRQKPKPYKIVVVDIAVSHIPVKYPLAQ